MSANVIMFHDVKRVVYFFSPNTYEPRSSFSVFFGVTTYESSNQPDRYISTVCPYCIINAYS